MNDEFNPTDPTGEVPPSGSPDQERTEPGNQDAHLDKGAGDEQSRETNEQPLEDASDTGQEDESAEEPAKAEAPGAQESCPTLITGPRMLQDNIKQASRLLAATGEFFYRNGRLVRVRRSGSQVSLQEVGKAGLMVSLDAMAIWIKPTRSDEQAAHPPERVCSALLTPGWGFVPSLNGLAMQPHFRPDGSLITEPGYDQLTGIYSHFDPEQYPIPTLPTRADAEASLAKLEELLADFTFADPVQDKAAALAAMLTAATRLSLEAAPLFHVRAHQAGTGKSYLCRVIGLLATAHGIKTCSFPSSSEECSKALLAALRANPEVVELDNLSGDLLPHESLCSILTADRYTGRLLGHSEMSTVSTRALFLSSGNNVVPVGDMTRRCVVIDMDAACDMPAGRVYANPSLLEDAKRRRSELVAAALTIVRFWITQGQPDMGAKPLASFGQWSRFARLPLMLLGRPDPAASLFAAMVDDPQRSAIGRVLEQLHVQFGSSPVQTREIHRRAHDPAAHGAADLLEALQEALGTRTVTTLALGKWLGRHVGHMVGGMRLQKVPVMRNANVWTVDKP